MTTKMEVDGMPQKIMPIIASVGVLTGTSLPSTMIVDLPGEGSVFWEPLNIRDLCVVMPLFTGGGISLNSYCIGMSVEVSGVAETVGGLMIPEMKRTGPNPSLPMKGWNSESKHTHVHTMYLHMYSVTGKRKYNLFQFCLSGPK